MSVGYYTIKIRRVVVETAEVEVFARNEDAAIDMASTRFYRGECDVNRQDDAPDFTILRGPTV